MTTEEAIEILENGDWWVSLDGFYEIENPECTKLHDAVDMAIAALRAQQEAEKSELKAVMAETNIFDKEETYENCTVQVLTNTVTGDVSVGWWRSDDRGES